MQGVKWGSRGKCEKQWKLFLEFSKDPNKFEDCMPTEKEMIDYLSHLCFGQNYMKFPNASKVIINHKIENFNI